MMHICATCGRGFTRQAHLVRHSSRCRPKPFVCTVCNSSFGRKWDLDHHKRTVKCGSPPQPEPAPKRRRIASLDEDPLTPPPVEPSNDNLSSELLDAVRVNWGSIRTYLAQGPVQTRYNHRLTTMDTRELQEPPLQHVRNISRAESVLKKQRKPYHKFKLAIHDRVQKPTRCDANDYIGQTDVSRSSQVCSGGVRRCNVHSLWLSSDRPET